MLDMKEKSVKSMMKSGGRDAAPATGKQENQGGKGRKGKPSGPDAAPVLPKAKAKGPAVPATEARVRAEVKITHVGITSRQRRDA